VKEIIKKNLYEKFDEDFDELLYFLEAVDSYDSYFYDGDFIENDCTNESREINDNMFKYIKEFDEDLESIARELNINDDKIRKEDKKKCLIEFKEKCRHV